MLNLTTIVDAVRDLTAALKEVAFELREARLMLTKKPQQLQNKLCGFTVSKPSSASPIQPDGTLSTIASTYGDNT